MTSWSHIDASLLPPAPGAYPAQSAGQSELNASMEARLIIVEGKASKPRVSVRLPTVIGRSREADLTVAHPMISRRHCELYEVNGLVMIRDLGSLNGTFVGQKPVSEAALYPDAEFSVGPLKFRIEYEYVGEIAAPPGDVSPIETGEQTGPGDEGAAGAPRAEGRSPEIRVPEGLPGVDETLPVDVEPAPEEAWPTIAPPDGQLPDFSAWAEDDAASLGAEREEDTPVSPASPERSAPPIEGDSAKVGQEQQPEFTPPTGPSTAPPASDDRLAVIEPGETADSEEARKPPVEEADVEQTSESDVQADSDSDESDQTDLSDDEDLNAFLRGLP